MTLIDSKPLESLRAEIDRLDDAILDLVERRLEATAAVAAAKGRAHRLKIRPRRQAAVLARLSERARRAPPALVAHIWRELMAHALQAQAPTEIILCLPGDPVRIEALVRAHFGAAAAIRWAADPADALRRAEREEAIAILAHPLARPDTGLLPFDVLKDEEGRPIGHAIGRVAPEDAADGAGEGGPGPAFEAATSPRLAQPASLHHWSPVSWRARKAAQMPVYPDAAALAGVETRLASSPPLVAVPDVVQLKAQLAEVAAGRAFLLQGGDCAESFAEFGTDKVRSTFTLLLEMGAMLRARSGTDIVHLARIAGQFAKPRSALGETIDGVTLPSYRGDAVNGMAFTHASRTPDPRRLLDAHRQAQVTIQLLQAYAAAGLDGAAGPAPMFTSHEALLLNYEQALTRFDAASESWWATSGHMIWIGDRTRDLDGAHVEFARGVANPIGLKCGPSLDADALLRLMDRLDPNDEPGQLVLIGRFGAERIAAHLPALMRATRREGRQSVWSIDPMHGNTRSLGRLKTRRFGDIVREIETFFAVAQAERIHAGGVHLEMTGADVTECLGGSSALAEEDLPRRYLTHCDPRLNRRQALDAAAAVAELLGRGALASNAA